MSDNDLVCCLKCLEEEENISRREEVLFLLNWVKNCCYSRSVFYSG